MIDVSAILQIAILYAAIYAILKRARGSRFGQVLMGVGILATLAAVFTFVFHFDVLGEIIRMLLIYLALSTVVIFQPEIRRILAAVGAFGRPERESVPEDGTVDADSFAATLVYLADRRIGALIAFERGISLRGYEQTGIVLDARFSRELAVSVFTPPLPLHDGGMTMRDGRVSSAHCIFPVSNNPNLLSSGMRHRSAVGLSEETDALVIVVSEESGTISVAHNGHLYRYAKDEREPQVRRWLVKALNGSARRGSLMKTVLGYVQRLVQKAAVKSENATRAPKEANA